MTAANLFLAMVMAAFGAFGVTLFGVYVWVNMPSPPTKRARD